jgi:hypothetical protein
VDTERFDSWVRWLTTRRSRRAAVTRVLGGSLSLLALSESEAKKRKKRKKKRGSTPVSPPPGPQCPASELAIFTIAAVLPRSKRVTMTATAALGFVRDQTGASALSVELRPELEPLAHAAGETGPWAARWQREGRGTRCVQLGVVQI